MTAAHPITTFCIWAFEQGFTIIGIKHILRHEFNIRGRRVTDAISKSLAPRQIRKNEASYDYARLATMIQSDLLLEDLVSLFDDGAIDYWSIKQLLKESSIWEKHESKIIWRRFQRLLRKEQRHALAEWNDRALTSYVVVNGIFVP